MSHESESSCDKRRGFFMFDRQIGDPDYQRYLPNLKHQPKQMLNQFLGLVSENVSSGFHQFSPVSTVFHVFCNTHQGLKISPRVESWTSPSSKRKQCLACAQVLEGLTWSCKLYTQLAKCSLCEFLRVVFWSVCGNLAWFGLVDFSWFFTLATAPCCATK